MERILIIRLSQLGDVVLVEPVIRALRIRFPSAKIELLTHARLVPLMKAVARLDAVHGYDYRGDAQGYAGAQQTAEQMISRRFSLVIDLQAKLRTRWITTRLSAQGARCLTLKKRSLGQSLLSVLGHDPPIQDRHTVDLYLSTIAPILGTDAVLVKDARAPLLKRLETAAGGVRRIGLSVGATHATKRWAPERFAQLADALHAERELEFVLVGGPQDRSLLEGVRACVRAARVLDDDLAALDVLGLAQHLSALDLLVSVDTGPAHLAAAMGVPVVALFGPTSPVRWGPIGAAHETVTLALDCAPCSNTGGPKCPVPDKRRACLDTLPVGIVQEAVLRKLPKDEGV